MRMWLMRRNSCLGSRQRFCGAHSTSEVYGFRLPKPGPTSMASELPGFVCSRFACYKRSLNICTSSIWSPWIALSAMSVSSDARDKAGLSCVCHPVVSVKRLHSGSTNASLSLGVRVSSVAGLTISTFALDRIVLVRHGRGHPRNSSLLEALKSLTINSDCPLIRL